MSRSTGRCHGCRHWAAYGGEDRWGECTMAEAGRGASLHVVDVRVGSGGFGPYSPPPPPVDGRQEVAPGCYVIAVLVTDRAFGCTSFDAKRREVP